MQACAQHRVPTPAAARAAASSHPATCGAARAHTTRLAPPHATGEPTPFSWPDVNSHFGVLDIAGFEKDSAGYYRAWWRSDGASFLKLVPADWNAPVPLGSPITLRAYTGAAAVEAFVNGISLGKQAVQPFGVTRWPAVPFAPGNISALAYDADGHVVATSVVATTGAPAALRVTPVAVGAPTYAADGQDVALFTVEVVDAAGAVVPNANPLITFTVAGPGAVYGLGNGDPADHTPDKVGDPTLPYGGVWARAAWMGLARAVVQTRAGAPGTITLTATAPGLTPGSASVTSQ
jgi:beta-galactosidase